MFRGGVDGRPAELPAKSKPAALIRMLTIVARSI